MGSIHKLSEDVINRIAAGEVVQRPSAALKELLENAIDAGCSRVQVVAAEGGLEVLQVSDDGSGIHKADLPLLCQRYATSKLEAFEDLQRITSFGFRGEALASISYVSRVTVTTRRRASVPQSTPKASSAHSSSLVSSTSETAAVAWRCRYLNGALLEEPQPCAGNPGTTIRAEKLFYNELVRRHSLRSSEEWGRLVDVVSRYALAFPSIGFTCQRDTAYGVAGGGGGGASSGNKNNGSIGNGSGTISFPPRSTTLQNIRIAQGGQIAARLRLVYAYDVGTACSATADATLYSDGALPCTVEDTRVQRERNSENGLGAVGGADDPSASASDSSRASSPSLTQNAAQETRVFAQMEQRACRVRATTGGAGEGLFTIVGYTSDPTLALRKPYLCLFINNRLVESAAIRKAIDGVYSGVLTGGQRPFTVLFLSIPTDRVDVNVHPTKKEVCLLDEDLIVSRVAEICRGAVFEAAAARQMDMLKMRHTAALALKQLPVADGVGAEDVATTAAISGSSSQHILEKLQEQHRRGIPLASPLTSSAHLTTASMMAGAGGGPAVVVAPCTMVRVEPQKGALDRYFSQRVTALATAPAPASTSLAALTTATSLSSAPVSLSASSSQVTPQPQRAGAGPRLVESTHRAPNSAEEEEMRKSPILSAEGCSPDDACSATTVHHAGMPSWAAVMASLPDFPMPCTDGEGEGNREADGSPVELPLTEVRGEKGEMTKLLVRPQEEMEGKALVPLGATSALHATSDDMEGCDRVGRTGGGGEEKAQAAAKREGSEDAEEDDEDGDDEMREFKRHRREVYARVQQLHRDAPRSTVAATMSTTSCVTLPAAAPAVGKDEEVCASEGPIVSVADALPKGLAPLGSTSASEQLLTTSHLGAVVRASDLLRREAANSAALDPSHFSHCVIPDDDRDEEEAEWIGRGSGDGGGGEMGARRDSTVSNDGVGLTALVNVEEVPAPVPLSSVSLIVDGILEDGSLTADNFIHQLTFVGVVDAQAFLAQVGTTLLWCDTAVLVHHAVIQRIFLRWGQPALPAPPVLAFEAPVPLTDLLLAGLAFDGPRLQPPSATLLALVMECVHHHQHSASPVPSLTPLRHTAPSTASAATAEGSLFLRDMTVCDWQRFLFHVNETSSSTEQGRAESLDRCSTSDKVPPKPRSATSRYVRRLVRRLCRWRGLLKDYFYISISEDGLLTGLPYGLNRHWPPRLRAVPLLMWLLAEAVPYPGPVPPTCSPTRAPVVGQPGMTAANDTGEDVERGDTWTGIGTPVSTDTAAPPSSVHSPIGTQTTTAVGTVSQISAAEGEAEGVALEVSCFTAIAKHIAETLYDVFPPPPSSSLPSLSLAPRAAIAGTVTGVKISSPAALHGWREELVQHALFPCLKNPQLFRLPDHCLSDGTIRAMVTVESLYKVFERC